MNRRKYLSVAGTVGLGAVAIGVVYQIDQGNIDIGEEAEISDTVHRTPETYTFEANAGEEIFITIREQEEGRRRGQLTLVNPNGDEVIGSRFSLSGNTYETHTVEHGGTYRLTVHPRRGRYRVAVSIRDLDD